MAVPRPGHNGQADYIATSVMLLDCAKLKHWQFDKDLDDLFGHRFDYVDWIELKREDRATIGFLEPEWNNFDRLTSRTGILHTTKRRTQPWKTGLPVDYTLRERGPFDFLRRWRSRHYEAHPDPQAGGIGLFAARRFGRRGEVTKEELKAEMAANHVRHDFAAARRPLSRLAATRRSRLAGAARPPPRSARGFRQCRFGLVDACQPGPCDCRSAQKRRMSRVVLEKPRLAERALRLLRRARPG